MIEELRITSLGVIEESVLELGPGLSVITGETGAGKTMLVTALGLLMGGRADSGAVRSGARAARVEGVFRVANGVADRVEELGGSPEGDDAGTAVLLARQVSAEGRSRAFAGGASVPAAVLADLTDDLVAVHGQSDQHRLLHADAQREALDAFAGASVAEPLAEYVQAFARYQDVRRELREVVEHARERAREADLLRHGLGEIEAVAPTPGEEALLAAEETRLGNADTLRTATLQARDALSADTVTPDSADALGAIAAARRSLDAVREHDPALAALADRLAESAYVLSDLAADVASYSAGLESDPARLAAVSERRAALGTLTRKYGDSIDDVLAWAEAGSRRLLELDDTDERIDALRAESARLREALGALATRISAARTEHAERLADRVGEELTRLAMPHARVGVVVRQREDADGVEVAGRPVRLGHHGADEVELVLAANRGAEPRPLHKGASGGELSRVMLALEVTLAGTSPVPTFVFDEVDAGVGGKAAVEIGRRLAMLSGSAQVVVVTHLPQVAAFADRHVVVRKSTDGLVTTSGLAVLEDSERVTELSRMLAGLEESRTAHAHAEELLATAREARASAPYGV